MNDNQNPTADQPLVTHADLATLREIRGGFCGGRGEGGCALEDCGSSTHPEADLLDRLIAHAEADMPALPKGWVLLDFPDGTQRVLWHSNGQLYVRSGNVSPLGEVDWGDRRERLTPLVTAASLVPEGWHVDEDGEGRPTVWDADDMVILGRVHKSPSDPLFDVLAALVSAAEAERGESR